MGVIIQYAGKRTLGAICGNKCIHFISYNYSTDRKAQTLK